MMFLQRLVSIIFITEMMSIGVVDEISIYPNIVSGKDTISWKLYIYELLRFTQHSLNELLLGNPPSPLTSENILASISGKSLSTLFSRFGIELQ